jgi:hypothetical protein
VALPYELGDLLQLERRVLVCLGAALVSEWNGLPNDVQRRLSERAASASHTTLPYGRHGSPVSCKRIKTIRIPPSSCALLIRNGMCGQALTFAKQAGKIAEHDSWRPASLEAKLWFSLSGRASI